MSKRALRLLTGLLCLCLCLSFACFLPQRASAELEIGKLLTTVTPTPVALMDVNQISAATSTGGCYISAYTWYDASGQVLTGSFGTGSYTVELQLTAADGYYFSPSMATYMNNSQCTAFIDSGQKYVTLTRTYTPDVWAPTVIKSPGSETVEEGGWASFAATASYASGCTWEITTAGLDKTYAVADLPSLFPDVTVGPDGQEKMNIYNIPAYMDGWLIRCVFSGPGGDSYTNYATITVKYEKPPEPSPAPEPTAPPSPSASPDAEAPAAGDADEEHQHSYSELWSYDDKTHWRECSCGDRSQQGTHSMEWTVLREASKKAAGEEQGQCSVCGYSTQRELEYASAGQKGVARYVIWGLGGLVALTLAVLAVDSIIAGRRRRRRRRRRR